MVCYCGETSFMSPGRFVICFFYLLQSAFVLMTKVKNFCAVLWNVVKMSFSEL